MKRRLPPSRGARLAVGAVAVMGLLLVVTLVVDALAPTPSGPRSSSYATAPDGLAGWAALLKRLGYTIAALRSDPSDASLPRGGTVVLLDPDIVPADEALALRRFAQRGGRVVAGGSNSAAWARALVAEDRLSWAPALGGLEPVTPLAPAPEVAGVGRVEGGGARYTRAGGTLPVLGDRRGALVAVTRAGRGRVILVADAAPLQNARLARADNAQLALGLAGPRGRVTFVETVHGYTERTGLDALPDRFQTGLVLLLFAGLLLMLARGRRFGPPEASARALPPERAEYVAALARALARARRREEAIAPVRAAARERLRRRAGVPLDAAPERVRDGALAAGLDEAAARVLAGAPAGGDAQVLAAGRALALLESHGRPLVVHDRPARDQEDDD